MVRTPSIDHRVLDLLPGAAVRHRDLPLSLVSQARPDDLTGIVGTVDKVWVKDDAVWASGTIQLDPNSPLGERMLARTPQPVGVTVESGTIEQRDEKWWHHIDRALGTDHPTMQVHQDWQIAYVALVEQSAWRDAFITIDDDPHVAPSADLTAPGTPTRQ